MADTLWSPRWRRAVRIFGLAADRAELAGRIAARTRAMFDAGVEAEVAAAIAAAGGLSATARRIHGLQDVAALRCGAIDREEAIRRLTVRTRRYARRQRTWMRRIPDLIPIDASAGAESAAEAMLECL
jgi:tRNA dimethylallyltransferase